MSNTSDFIVLRTFVKLGNGLQNHSIFALSNQTEPDVNDGTGGTQYYDVLGAHDLQHYRTDICWEYMGD